MVAFQPSERGGGAGSGLGIGSGARACVRACVRVDFGFLASACLACFPRLLHDLDSWEVCVCVCGGSRVLISLDHLLGPIPRGIFLMG